MKTTFEFDDYVKTSNPAPLSDIVSSHPTAGVESLGREDALDLNFVELTETEFGNLGNQFISNIEFNGQAILDAHIAEIPFDKMKGFLDEASGKKEWDGAIYYRCKYQFRIR